MISAKFSVRERTAERRKWERGNRIVLKRLLTQLESYTKKAPETVLDRIIELEARRADQRRELRTAENELEKARRAAADAPKFSVDFTRLMMERQKPETRLVLPHEIRSIVSRIDVFFDISETRRSAKNTKRHWRDAIIKAGAAHGRGFQ